MRLATYNKRLKLLQREGDQLLGIDVALASDGRFGPDALSVLEQWDTFRAWAAGIPANWIKENIEPAYLEAPIPNPRQIFAIGMNYPSHAKETGLSLPSTPAVFTKFVSSVSGPFSTLKLPSDTVDWEVELVVVIGRSGRNIDRQASWNHIAGFMIGQDLSERTLQFSGNPAQFSMGKSFQGFAPTGPWLTTLDELPNPEDLAIGCSRSGQELQASRTSNMVFDIPELIVKLSQVVELLPGDLIFTGTPDGVGIGRSPKEYLRSGDALISTIEGLGEMRQTFI